MLHHILYFILIGALAGIFGGSVLKRSRSGRIGNVIIGIVGSLIGRYLYGLMITHESSFALGPYISAGVFAMIALWVMDVVRGRRER